MFCPTGQTEYCEVFTACADCRVPLIHKLSRRREGNGMKEIVGEPWGHLGAAGVAVTTCGQTDRRGRAILLRDCSGGKCWWPYRVACRPSASPGEILALASQT